jgi:hypothetical protein
MITQRLAAFEESRELTRWKTSRGFVAVERERLHPWWKKP